MNIKDLEALAELARLELTKEEEGQLLKDFEGILDYVKQIESVQVEDTDSKYDIYNVWREDKTEDRDFSKDGIIKQFPDSQDNFLKVKKII
jgi:aspartyl-tRNA(Asn)/glutamyl-tRNA(Gln) amidotransferase subunit C